ncbi:hypothetical protein AURDEDRAFT_117453, partial [Auricularia subglabra TFB-10046 SS5]
STSPTATAGLSSTVITSPAGTRSPSSPSISYSRQETAPASRRPACSARCSRSSSSRASSGVCGSGRARARSRPTETSRRRRSACLARRSRRTPPRGRARARSVRRRVAASGEYDGHCLYNVRV